MSERSAIAQRAAAALRDLANNLRASPAMIGFDGFVDSIISVVDKRRGPDDFDKIPTIDAFGRKIVAAAGQSSNYELVVNLQKLGGNGPIMANAIATIGLPTTYVGGLGHPTIHPVFEELSNTATCHSIAEPGFTDALEFEDGKLMLGKIEGMNDVNWPRLESEVGAAKFTEIIGRSRLIGMVNWTMLPYLNGIWRKMIDDLLPQIEPHELGRRILFIDLADPEKRTSEDLKAGLELVSGFSPHVDTTLGVNLKEALQAAEVLGITVGADPEAEIESMAVAIREKLDIQAVVVHPRSSAAAAIKTGDADVASARFAGPFVRQPKLSTGAGDNFNAGFCVGRLAGLDPAGALCVGTATSGYYVRNAGSPSIFQLAEFCENLPEPE